MTHTHSAYDIDYDIISKDSIWPVPVISHSKISISSPLPFTAPEQNILAMERLRLVLLLLGLAASADVDESSDSVERSTDALGCRFLF